MRAALANAGKITCPHCGFTDTYFAEDVTNTHKLLTVREKLLIFRAQTHELGPAFNQRIGCRECGEESLLPDGYDLAFE